MVIDWRAYFVNVCTSSHSVWSRLFAVRNRTFRMYVRMWFTLPVRITPFNFSERCKKMMSDRKIDKKLTICLKWISSTIMLPVDSPTRFHLEYSKLATFARRENCPYGQHPPVRSAAATAIYMNWTTELSWLYFERHRPSELWTLKIDWFGNIALTK